MSLLFDQNLSFRLVQLLAPEYPASMHVRDCGFTAEDDQEIWDYARSQGLIIVSKDSDFQYRALLYGSPPKVIWVRIGNGPTAAVAHLLRSRKADIDSFAADSTAALLVLP